MVKESQGLTIGNGKRFLTAQEFHKLADVPPEAEWFANLKCDNTRRAYKNDVKDFMTFAGLEAAEDFRSVQRSHLIEWRKQLEARELGSATVRRKLAAIGSLFDYLCNANAVAFNPADGVKRPNAGANEGKSPALGDEEGRDLLEAPSARTLIGCRDRAILSTLLQHGLRRAELCALKVGDIESRRGTLHFKVNGKGGKIRYIPIHSETMHRLTDYLAMRKRKNDEMPEAVADEEGFELKDFGNKDAVLFTRVLKGKKRRKSGGNAVEKALTGQAIYKNVVQKYALQLGIDSQAICVHGLRATAATNALDHQADIAKVQEWLGHSSILTTRLYDRRQTKPADSPTFKVSY
jgi:site-specific recombinase XerD